MAGSGAGAEPASRRSPPAARSPTTPTTGWSWSRKEPSSARSTKTLPSRACRATSSSSATSPGRCSASSAARCGSRTPRASRPGFPSGWARRRPGAPSSPPKSSRSRAASSTQRLTIAARHPLARGGRGNQRVAAEQLVEYLAESKRLLGALPTDTLLVAERFFDEAGGMQLVIHSPLGSRINKAWGLALRKRFCRQFNFELQAAATEDAVLLSLGPQHSFPLETVFRFLNSGVGAGDPGAGGARRAGVRDPVALECEHLARGAAVPGREEGAAAAAAHGSGRPAGRGLPRRRRLPREHPRRPGDPGSPAGRAGDRGLPPRGDGSHRAPGGAPRNRAGRSSTWLATCPSRRRWRTRS